MESKRVPPGEFAGSANNGSARAAVGALDTHEPQDEIAFDEIPARLVIEWTADGADYIACGTFEDEEFARRWRAVRAVFAAAPHKLTRKDVLIRWPKGSRPPERISLLRWLLRKDGQGLRNKPFRYWLPEMEEAWRQDPLACFLMPELREAPPAPP